MRQPNWPEKLDRTQFPELDLILWDCAARCVSHQVAFSAYERRWKYVDANNLTRHEQALLDFLIQSVGNGLFLAA